MYRSIDIHFLPCMSMLLLDLFIYIYFWAIVLATKIALYLLQYFCVAVYYMFWVLLGIGVFFCLYWGNWSPRYCNYLLLIYIIPWIYLWLTYDVLTFSAIFHHCVLYCCFSYFGILHRTTSMGWRLSHFLKKHKTVNNSIPLLYQ